MKNLLYIGNKLTKKGLNATTIDVLSKQLQEEGYFVVSTSSKKNQLLRLLDMIFSIVKYNNVDYVLIDTYSTSAFWYAFFTSQFCRLFNLKYIPILHGGNLPFRLDKNSKFSKMIFHNAYINIAPSNYLLNEFRKRGFTNIIYIPNSIEVDKYIFKLRNQIHPKLIWVRAFASIYNPKMAVDVLRKLKEKFPEASLCMVGPDKDGSLQTTKDYAKSLHLDVEFTGKLSKEEWCKLASNYDIFINTTNFDNTPVSVIEAMSLGLPIVSTNVGGIPFLIDDNQTGLLVDQGNVDSMVNAIELLLVDNELTEKLSENGRLKAESFNWDVTKKEWLNVLK